MSAIKRILKLLQDNVGKEVTREQLRSAAGISEWARRVRELTQQGWDITPTVNGYILQSLTRKEAKQRVNISTKQRYRILHRDHSTCRRCGRTVEDGVKLVIDHILPVDWGGLTEDSNLWTLCDECNHGKQAWQSDVDAETMKKVMAINGARARLKAYFELRAGQECTREEIQLVAGISEYARRIRELRAKGMNITVAKARGNYVYQPATDSKD